jgi:exopolysaccharide biosynthesis polyprenyl glycosylphosphotransferase
MSIESGGPDGHGSALVAVPAVERVDDSPAGGDAYEPLLRRIFRGPWWRDSLLRRLLALADLLTALIVSLAIGVVSGAEEALYSLLALPMWILLAKLQGLYDRDQRALRRLTVDEVPRLLLWTATGIAGVALVLALAPPGPLGVAAAVEVWVLALLTAPLLRTGARVGWRRLTPPERTLIVGRGPLAEATRRKLQLFSDMHLRITEEPARCVDDVLARQELLRGFDRVIVAEQTNEERAIETLIAACRREQIKLSLVPPIRGMFGTAVQLDHVADLPVVQYNTWDVPRSTLLLKRCLDTAVSLVALTLLAPLFLIIAAAIRLDSRGPMIFAQTRAGLGGRPFRMFKFRTMVSNAEALLPRLVPFETLEEPMFKLRDDPRVTRAGRLLRRASLDELPQLVNVLKGEMSLVGPRPEQIELVARYAPEERFRLAVKPGLTGPMQVFGRGELTFEERLAVERDYIENLSIGRDLRVLAMTLATVVNGKGAF